MRRSDRYFWFRIVVAATAIILAGLRLALDEGDRMDVSFLALLGIAALVLVLPWERIAHFRAGPFEFALQETQVRALVHGVQLEQTTRRELRQTLESLSDEIERARGSRVLWVDDRPAEIVGARRLFRMMGSEVVSATSNEEAIAILRRDNDFDLIITDTQRRRTRGAEKKPERAGIGTYHGGVEFVAFDLPQFEPDSTPRNRGAVTGTPVIFYAAYPLEDLKRLTRPAMDRDPKPELANRVDDLLQKAFPILAEMRSTPLKIPAEKKPTSPQ